MAGKTYEAELEELLHVDQAGLQARARALADELAACPGPLVLFGAGRLGRIVRAGLHRAGVAPAAFADNNQALWNTSLDGLPVLSATEAARRFGAGAVFVVTIYTGAGVRRQLRDMGLRVFPSAQLFFRHAHIFLPHAAVDWPERMLPHSAAVRQGLALWADDASREEFIAQVRYRLSLDERLPACLPPETTYFPEDLIPLTATECFVDCGAFDGDSIRSFLERRETAFGRIIAIEPDPGNCGRFRQFVTGLPEALRGRITVHQNAVGSRRQIVRFDATGTAASAVGSGGTVEVECAPLDELLRGETPTYIKMDIEGAEPDALAGAAEVIARHKPVLAICLYHQQDHLWKIPLQIRSLCRDYRLYLRRYSDDCWEQVCYAVPPGR